MKVLVTGSTSLIGQASVAALVARGDQVTVFQRRARNLTQSGLTKFSETLREVLGDVTSAEDVRRAIAGQEGVIHLAARVGVVGSQSDFEEVNVYGTQNLIEAAQGAGVERFVHVSSPSVAHGGSALVGAPAGKADPSKTRGHYSTSKAKAELMALKASSEAMPITAIRPHLVWGPGDEQLVGRIVARAKDGRLALVGSGAALIDSIYVDNAADALLAALDRAPQLAGQAFVVCNAQPRTVAELFARILDAAGIAAPTRHVPASTAFAGGLLAERAWDKTNRTEDPPMTSFLAEQLSTAHWFDQRETQAALDWAPQVDLDEGFARLKAWFDQNPAT